MVAGRLDPPVTVVLEGQAKRGAEEAVADGVEVVHAPGEGDDTIAAIAAAHDEVIVVTADRGLAARCGRATPRWSGRAGCSTGWWTEPGTRAPAPGGREPPARSLRSGERSSAGAEGGLGGFGELVQERRVAVVLDGARWTVG